MRLPRYWGTTALLLPLLWTALGPVGTESNDRPASFSVSLSDPVVPEAPPRQYEVVATSDGDGSPTGYRLTFQVNVCTDGQCRMVNITMHWDSLGFYQRLECPIDAPLTRREHDPFTPEDYRKLDRILKNRESILGRLPFEALVEQPRPGEAENIDGWSGATPQTVADSVVEGAAFTTWTLWHWANGDIVPHLRAATKQRATPKYIRQLLRSEDHREVYFGLQHALEQSRPDEQFVVDAFHVMENTRQVEHVSLALELVSRAMSDQHALHERLIAASTRMTTHTSRPIIEYFAAQPGLPAETLEALSGILGELPYFQVHRILLLLQKQACSAKVEANIAGLLDHDDFFIARRASEHLVKQTPSDSTRRKLDAFRDKYRDRL
ncbi:MAG: hypothetical protein RBS80_08800 [Thermoguttaceae bacterium]|jgi:hypothetical protein|nr:hypothetical protein [Thermoguttaceae bacterium]